MSADRAVGAAMTTSTQDILELSACSWSMGCGVAKLGELSGATAAGGAPVGPRTTREGLKEVRQM